MPEVATPPKPKKERLPANERLALTLGLGLILFFTLGMGLMMLGLRHTGPAADPDAKTPVIAPDFPRRLVDFSLIDQTGRPVTRQDLAGKIVVVNFVFTTCAVVCPYVNGQMQRIQQLTAQQPDVRLVSLALDPVDDTAPVLANYGKRYGEDAGRWSMLTGDTTEMRRFVGTSFLPPDTTGEFSYMPGNFAHSQRIVLIDSQGHVVKYFDGLNQQAAEAVVAEIAKLRKTPL